MVKTKIHMTAFALLAAAAAFAGGEPCGDAMVTHRFYIARLSGCLLRSFDSSSAEKFVPTDEEMEKAYGEHGWKKWLSSSFGVTWPEGSMVREWNEPHAIWLYVRNTRENIAAIQDFLEPVESVSRLGRPNIELRVHMVDAPREALDACGWDAATPPEDAAKLLRSLLSRDDVSLAAEFSSTRADWENVIIKSGREVIYPTEFDVVASTGPRRCDTNATQRVACADVGFAACEPRSFTMRETGWTFDATAALSSIAGGGIEIKIILVRTGEPEWKDYGMEYVRPDGVGAALRMEQPIFRLTHFRIKIKVRSGQTAVFLAPSVEDGRHTLCFVTAHAATADGRPLFRLVEKEREGKQ